MKKILLAAALSMLLAGAALAGSCSTYCGSFAGYHWGNTRGRGSNGAHCCCSHSHTAVLLVRCLLYPIDVAQSDFPSVFWNFVRSAVWLNVGIFMLFWWTDKPHDWDTMMPGIVFFTGLGALGTFVRWRKKQQAMQAIPTMPAWPTPADAAGNIAPIIEVEYKSVTG